MADGNPDTSRLGAIVKSVKKGLEIRLDKKGNAVFGSRS